MRYEAKGELDCGCALRAIPLPIAGKPIRYVVMMMGVSDRSRAFASVIPAGEADKKKGKDQAEKPAADKTLQKKDFDRPDESGADPRCPAWICRGEENRRHRVSSFVPPGSAGRKSVPTHPDGSDRRDEAQGRARACHGRPRLLDPGGTCRSAADAALI